MGGIATDTNTNTKSPFKERKGSSACILWFRLGLAIWFLRLCLVAVKHFSENTYFSEMLISGKGKYFHVFGCISKNFPENIF